MLWVFATYLLAVDVLPNFLLLIINCSGYLPYSDRPGPGWQPPHWPHWEELSFFIGFALYLGIPTCLYATGQTILARICELCSLPKWVVGIVGSILGFFASALSMAAAGWMIALSPLGVYLAAGCGLVWGALVLPWIVKPRQQHVAIGIRIALPIVLTGAAAFALIYPLLPKTPEVGITFEISRITPGAGLISADKTPYLKAETQSEIEALNLRGDLHGGIQSALVSAGDPNGVDVVVLALQPIDHEYKLEVPAKGHVVYVLENSKLTAHPSLGKKDKKTILIEPGVDKTYEGGRIKVGSDRDFTAFTWYPPIAR